MWRNFSTWQFIIWKNFSTWQIFSPQAPLVVLVTNITYAKIQITTHHAVLLKYGKLTFIFCLRKVKEQQRFFQFDEKKLYPIIESLKPKVLSSWSRYYKRETISVHSWVNTCEPSWRRCSKKIKNNSRFFGEKLGMLVVSGVPEDWAGSCGQMRVVRLPQRQNQR